MVHDNGKDPGVAASMVVESVSESASASSHAEAMARIIVHLADSSQAIERLTGQVAALTEQIEQVRAQDRLLEELQERNRELREAFYEREVLGPVIQGLIGIADRARRRVLQLQRTLNRREAALSNIGRHASQEVIQARTADLVDVEALLATFGVEPIHRNEKEFDPATQKCVEQVRCEEPDRHGRVARRVLPGYRRNQMVIRPEHVTVFVYETRNQGE